MMREGGREVGWVPVRCKVAERESETAVTVFVVSALLLLVAVSAAIPFVLFCHHLRHLSLFLSAQTTVACQHHGVSSNGYDLQSHANRTTTLLLGKEGYMWNFGGNRQSRHVPQISTTPAEASSADSRHVSSSLLALIFRSNRGQDYKL
ncbi:hypothetical protein VNO77_28597 [Canavalia gladiata]|uniref:Uncharacterized protein n=1 Tax=Canavalia gladiata TaxID=3824 RepID=A0AAN9KVN5_CANGL